MRRNGSVGIVGAGIGGLAAAVGLRRIGFEVTVFEASATLRVSGSALTIWSNAAAALADLETVG